VTTSRQKNRKLLLISATALVLGASALAYLTLSGHHAPTTAPDLTACIPAGPTQPDSQLPVPATPSSAAVIGTASGDVFNISGSGANARVDNYMTAAQKLGTHIVRVDLKWSDVQPTCSGPYDWNIYSYLFSSAAKHGLWVDAILDSPPQWAVGSCDQDPWKCAPAGSKSFAAFARGTEIEYGRQIDTIEVLNEPSTIDSYYNNVSAYGQLLSDTYVAVKSAAASLHTNVIVEPGGSAAIGNSSANSGMSPADWYQGLYNAGAKSVMDRINMHPYVYPETVIDNNPNSQWAQIAAVQRIMAASGDSAKPIDITEIGWPTGGGSLPPTSDRTPKWQPSQAVTESSQATFYNDLFGVIAPMHAAHVIGRVYVYSLLDDAAADPTSTEAHFGLASASGQHKPAWATVASWVQTLD
jgi:hypothetical protein